MANVQRGEVSFEAAGSTWTLLFSVNALCELEEAVGAPVTAIGDRMNDPQKLSMSLFRQVVWAGLREKHPDITLKRAGEIISAAGTAVVGPKLGEAFQAAFPDQQQPAGEGGEGVRPPLGKAGAG